MKRVTRIVCGLAAAVLLLSGCGAQPETPTEESEAHTVSNITSDCLYVRKVENLPADFIMGMDASCVPALEKSGVKYHDFDGTEKDVYEILSANGINYIRVRVWNDPFDAEGNGYGGGNCDIDNAVAIGQRATAAGMKLLVNFHYSDFWADPGKQMTPKAWKGMNIEQKSEALYQYTKECLQKLKDAGVDVGMVQIGNETNGAMCGEKSSDLGGWQRICQLMNAGAKATREVCPEAMVAIHFANPEKSDSYVSYGKNLDYYQVDYDVFASSYYPYWHGTLDNLANVLNQIADTYGKKVMVAETSYAFTDDDTDFSGNTISSGSGVIKDYPFTIQGQATCVRNVIDTVVNKVHNGIGVFYWEGTWITVGEKAWEENSQKWEQFGSGWASSYAAEYDPEDAGQWYGGCAVDNQAMFDASGWPLESLKIFALVREGNNVAQAVDALEDVNLICDLGKPIVLPETVNAIMNDGSTQTVAVTWGVTEEELTQMANGGVNKYTVSGGVDGMPVTAYISVEEYNYLQNWSFEEGQTGWVATALKSFDELKVEDKVTDSMTGNMHYHFWGAGADAVEFTLEQEVKELPAAKYNYSISIMGGDGGETEIYAYVKVNGEQVATAPAQITVYDEWHTATIENIPVSEGDTVTVGIYVKCAGPNAWGKIDDAKLNSVNE